MVSSATYITNERARRIYGETFRLCLEYIYGEHVPGAIAEFGTFEGFSALLLAELIAEFSCEVEFYGTVEQRHLYVYDSFAGFPESTDPVDAASYEVTETGYWRAGEDASPPGTQEMLRAEFARILGEGRWTIVPGMYADTLQSSSLAGPIALVNLDCDLYASTSQVLDHLLATRALPDGAVLLCDDYNCNRANPRFGQQRALRECFARAGDVYSYSEFLRYGWHGRAFFVHRHDGSPTRSQ